MHSFMKAEIVLTSSESKRLLAKALVSMDSVKRALRDGAVIVCRGTTNAYILEELLGSHIEKDRYAVGYIGPKGLGINPNPANETILVKGKVKEGATIADFVKELEPGDVIIKGANAIGPDGIPAVLIGRKNSKTVGGTIGFFQMGAMARGITVIVPVGLEKYIPISVLVGSKELSADKVDWATGVPCGLIPIFGTVVTEVEALKMLAGVEAIPIAAGGIGGAEGSVVLLIKGTEEQVQTAIITVKSMKGEPPVEEPA
jgi:hypothetical protein